MSTPALPLSSDAMIRRRCGVALRHHRAAAAKDFQTLDYDLGELLALARQAQVCAYCSRPLGNDATFDHVVPVGRTARAHRLANIVLCCPDCNMAKGSMDGDEYRRLLALLAGFDPRAAADVRRRLLSGGKRYARRKRKGGTP
jgi:5-methylcytosine-specific restriction endonuclease McrA